MSEFEHIGFVDLEDGKGNIYVVNSKDDLLCFNARIGYAKGAKKKEVKKWVRAAKVRAEAMISRSDVAGKFDLLFVSKVKRHREIIIVAYYAKKGEYLCQPCNYARCAFCLAKNPIGKDTCQVCDAPL